MPPGRARAAVPLDTVKFAGIKPGNILTKGVKAHRSRIHSQHGGGDSPGSARHLPAMSLMRRCSLPSTRSPASPAPHVIDGGHALSGGKDSVSIRHGRPRRVRSAATPPIARFAMSNDQRVSSRDLCRTFHVQSPSRLDKTRLYLVSRQTVELPIPASTHLLGKSGQKQGFITRMKAEPIDQIAGECCDLLSRRVKEWQSHRGARCNSRLRKLDVVPS